MKSTAVLVTPEMARQWLECNKPNRPLRPSWVSILTGMINRGEWRLTHQGIALDDNGNLLDGQHRLSAIIAAGQPVQMMVTTGLDPSVFGVLDRGRARSLRDITRDGHIHIAVISNIWRLFEGLPVAASSAPTLDQYLSIKAWSDTVATYALAHVTGAKHKLTPAAVVTAAAVRLMQRHDVMDQLQAMSRMDFGCMVPSVQALCRQLLSDFANTSVSRADVMARAYRAFDPDNANLTRIQIKDANVAVSEMRTVVITYAATNAKTMVA